MMDVCWYRVREFQVGWWLISSNLERVRIRSLEICLVLGHWRRICISVPVTCWSESQYGKQLLVVCDSLCVFNYELVGGD